MFLDPSSQYLNQFRLTDEVPERLKHLLIDGSNRQCLVAAGIQIVSQQIALQEFDLFIHHVFAKRSIELFGKTQTKKWIWVMQHEGNTGVSLANGLSFDLHESEHFIGQTEAGRENRFTIEKGRGIIILISLKAPGEKMIRQFYPDLWTRLQRADKHLIHHPSVYIERYYREGLLRPTAPSVLLNTFLSVQIRMLLLLLSKQLIEAPLYPGISSLSEHKVQYAKQLLDQHPGEHWTLSELSKRCNWNIQDLKIIFKQVYGTSPSQYLRDARLQLALLLVRSTDETIVTISRTCGFKLPHHFIRTFKQFTGKTPGEMRREAFVKKYGKLS